jgi:hypothetical protein
MVFDYELFKREIFKNKELILKFLIISPTPTHPTNAGNRKHILTLISELKDSDCEVFFYYINRETHDSKAMQIFFNDRLFIHNEQTKLNLIDRIRRKFLLTKKSLFDFSRFRKLRKIYNQPLDLDFPDEIIPEIQKIVTENQINTVIVEYVFLSRILKYLPRNVNKIIDTHDLFCDRFMVYLNQGLKPSWISLYPKEEIKGLKRADAIICLNESELEHYKKNGYSGSSMIYSNINLIRDLYNDGDPLTLIYLASGNEINIKSINDFIEHCFFKLLLKEPSLKLKIAGKISEHIRYDHPNIELMGYIDDIEEFYQMGKFVINPELHGTGQKIKSIEALRFNKTLITTTDIGIKGTQEISFYCTNYEDMKITILELLVNNEKRKDKLMQLELFRHKQKLSIMSLLVK